MSFLCCIEALKVPFLFAAEIYLEKNQHTSAELIYRDLIDRNPDNSAYYEQLEKCLKISKFCLAMWEGHLMPRLLPQQALKTDLPSTRRCWSSTPGPIL